jgi:hypothetical protein
MRSIGPASLLSVAWGLAGGSGSRFFEPVAKDVVDVGVRPGSGQHGFQAKVLRMTPEQKIADVRRGSVRCRFGVAAIPPMRAVERRPGPGRVQGGSITPLEAGTSLGREVVT